MNDQKENWIVATLRFIFELLKTGNDRIDRCIQIVMLICVLGTIVLWVIGVFMGQVGETLPGIFHVIDAFFQACLDWVLSFIPIGTTETAMMPHPGDVLPLPADTDVPTIPIN